MEMVTFMSFLFLLFRQGAIIVRCWGLQFHHTTFSGVDDTADISIVTQSWYRGPDAQFGVSPDVSSSTGIWLTPIISTGSDPTHLGRIVFKDPYLFDPATTASFQTSFIFQIITTREYGECGSGMAFFVSESREAPNNSDSYGAFGLLDPNQGYTLAAPQEASREATHFFAVEFDTRLHPINRDPSASHIGIDIDSVISSNTTDTSAVSSSSFYPDLYFYNNSTFMAWIDYDFTSKMIQVRMINMNSSSTSTASSRRPMDPCLLYSYDLSALFSGKYVFVGFSATSAPSTRGAEGHVIYAWNFSNEMGTESSKAERRRRRRRRVDMIVIVAAISVPSGLAAVLGAGAVVVVVFFRSRSGRRMERQRHMSDPLQEVLRAVPRYTYRELRRATDGFSHRNKVGEGGFSSVYRGVLCDGTVVAVKKLKEGARREAEFCAEVGIISKVRHRNLVEMEGWCYDHGEAMVVQRYMSGGSLDAYLFQEKKKKKKKKKKQGGGEGEGDGGGGGFRKVLEASERRGILEGVAAALDYLHHDSGLGECVLHRDVKAANVLLTAGMEAKLSDFGLARLVSRDRSVSMTAAGTPGSIAPEVIYRGKVTDRADVYSFGILALELAAGRRAICNARHFPTTAPLATTGSFEMMDDPHAHRCVSDNVYEDLLDFVWRLHMDPDRDIVETLDPFIASTAATDIEYWRNVLHLALLCCHPVPDCRPSMRHVVQVLRSSQSVTVPATRPSYPFGNHNHLSSSNMADQYHHIDVTGTSTCNAITSSSLSGGNCLVSDVLSPR